MNLLPVIFTLCVIIILIDNTDQIINGFIAEPGTFKYQVALIIHRHKLCSGAIIDEHHVLTAAHCISGYEASDILILAGALSLNDDNKIIRTVKQIHIHPYYYGGTRQQVDYFTFSLLHKPQNDIAVLKLRFRFHLGDRLQKICLPTSDLDYCDSCIVGGWGSYRNNSTVVSNELRLAELRILHSDGCEALMIPPSIHEFCASDPWTTSIPASGDSGSSLNCNGKIVGIVSFGAPNPKHPTVFVNVYHHLRFIVRSIGYLPTSDSASCEIPRRLVASYFSSEQ